ncbi:noggin-2-like [Adelges cooleyi]|uniref:noggin-2-like n=1 Tax=Adelges cooleyi TaxID=133065 RepID=UPI00217F5323|nr:noggin-2-like [Adelges cooleyi]
MRYSSTSFSVNHIVLTGLTWLNVAVSPANTATPAPKTTAFSLWFHTAPRYPKNRDMKIDKLDRLIGSDYDDMWMSKSTMITAQENSTSAIFDFDMSAPPTPDAIQLPEQLPVQYQELMRNWLVRRGSCPVEYVWTDLGKSFWPRWIKKGRCGRSETMSCSWPPGMSCIPSSIRVLNLLRWHCWLKNRKNKKRKQLRKSSTTVSAIEETTENGKKSKLKNAKKKIRKKYRCLWIKVPYPVTEDCTCSCRKLND